MDRPPSLRQNSPLVLNGVLSLAHAGTWLQMLRSKLSPGASGRRRSDFADVPDHMEGAALESSDSQAFPAKGEPNSFAYPLPLRHSRSEGSCDRLRRSIVYRRGGELSRTSSAGTAPIVAWHVRQLQLSLLATQGFCPPAQLVVSYVVQS